MDSNHPFFQTRTFENRGLIYIGMELPNELKQRFNQLSEELNQTLMAEGISDQMKRKQFVDAIMKEINYAFFQTVGDSYGYGDTLTMENMDKKFAARFDVEQNRVDQPFSQVTGPQGQKLLVTAAGDSFSSPHFMRYSGLTGARENILHLGQYSRSVNRDPEAQASSLERLDKAGRRTADFVIARGRNFLKALKDPDINKNRREKMYQSLDHMMAQGHPNLHMKKEAEGIYSNERIYSLENSQNGQKFMVSVNEQGRLVRQLRSAIKEYDSVMQMMHELS